MIAVLISVAVLLLAAVVFVLHRAGRPCTTCQQPVIDCLCPLHPDDAADCAASVASHLTETDEEWAARVLGPRREES
jgi:hypothetical protein